MWVALLAEKFQMCLFMDWWCSCDIKFEMDFGYDIGYYYATPCGLNDGKSVVSFIYESMQ